MEDLFFWLFNETYVPPAPQPVIYGAPAGPPSGDIALVQVGDGEDLYFDFAMYGPDLLRDDTLQTPVIISWFSERLAEADDVLPDNTGDRRGWWGDYPIDGAADAVQPDHIGSRLWLLERAKATTQTAASAQNYGLEAFAWLMEDGVANSTAFTATWLALGVLELSGSISRLGADGTVIDHKFDYVWNATLFPQPLVPQPSP